MFVGICCCSLSVVFRIVRNNFVTFFRFFWYRVVGFTVMFFNLYWDCFVLFIYFFCCFSVRITAVIGGLYRRVLLKKTGKVRAVQYSTQSFNSVIYRLLSLIHLWGIWNSIIRGGADKSLARRTSRCRRTESIVSLEGGSCSCAELQVFSCYRG